MITSYNTSLPNDEAHADAVDIGITIKPIPVRDNVIEHRTRCRCDNNKCIK